MGKKLHYRKYDAGLGFMNAIFFPAAFVLVYILIVSLLCGYFNWDIKVVEKSYWYIIPIILISPISFLLDFFVVNKYSNIDTHKALGLYNKVKVTNVLSCILISVICVFGIMHFVDFFDASLSALGFKGDNSLFLPLDNGWWLLLNLITIALLPAIFEELIFRGVIFGGLRDIGNIFAVFASAGLFMLVHGSVVQTIYPFIVGVMLGFVMLKTNNIIYPIIIHFCNNAFVLIFSFVQEQAGFATTKFTFTAYNILFAILMFVLSVLMVWLIIKFFIKGRKPVKREGDTMQTSKFMIIGIICAAILWIVDLLQGFGIVTL